MLLSDLALHSDWVKSKGIKNLVKIGEGRYSEVFSFDDPADGTTKALKVMKRPEEDNGEWIKDRNDELIMMELLKKSPHVLSYEDHFIDLIANPSLMFIVTEKAEMNLKQLVKKSGVLEETLLCRLIDTLVKGLIFAHERNIVHRGLKTENILYTSSQSFLMADWVMSKKTKQHDDGTLTNYFPSSETEHYFPPEIINSVENKSSTVNLFKADVYSFGLIILVCCGMPESELLSGLNKNEEISHSQMLEHYINNFVKQTYPWYADIIRKMCAFKPDDRCDAFLLQKLLTETEKENLHKSEEKLKLEEKPVKDSAKPSQDVYSDIHTASLIFEGEIEEICEDLKKNKDPKNIISLKLNIQPEKGERNWRFWEGYYKIDLPKVTGLVSLSVKLGGHSATWPIIEDGGLMKFIMQNKNLEELELDFW